MKVKCIINNGYWITFGEIYEVIHIYPNGNYIIIINNRGYKWKYPKKYFKTLSEIRNEKINKLLK
jgi:hypothetical protein